MYRRNGNLRRHMRFTSLVIASLLVLAGCTGSDGADDPSTTGESPAVDEAVGGTLRVAVSSDVLSFDPHEFNTPNFIVIKNFYDPLIEYTPELEPQPWLAESWEISDDNTSVTLRLRDDVVFHSGRAMTAADVAATLEKARDPERGQQASGPMQVVEGWETLDDYTIQVTFEGPLPDLQIFDLLQFTNVIDPEGMDDLRQEPAGTGPFVLQSHRPGEELVLAANGQYWRESEPRLDEVVIRVFDDQDAAVNALQTGDVDLVYGLATKDAPRLRTDFDVVTGPGDLVMLFVVNPNEPPFDNRLVRQAVQHAVNRQAIVDSAWFGASEPVVLPWTRSNPAYDASLDEEFEFNLDTARGLIAQSGLDESQFAVEMLVPGFVDEFVPASEILKSDLEQIGFTITLNVQDPAAFEDVYNQGQYAIAATGIGNAQKFPTRISTNTMFRTEENPVLRQQIFPEYLEAVDLVNTTVEPESAVQEAYSRLREVILTEAWAIPCCLWPVGMFAAAPNVQGVTLDIDNMPRFGAASVAP
jgi:peptide/nickel transport system substrate-binding protein